MTPPFLTGQLLLAMPGIGDPRFEKAVIAVCMHDERGALGIGIGRLAPRLGFHALLEQFDIPAGDSADAPVHLGGPVDPQRGFVLHSLDWGGQDTIEVDGRFALTNTIDVLRAVAEGKGPSRWLAALGYAGWNEGQLDEEMTRHGWFTVQATDTLLFDTPVEQRWGAAFQSAGVDPRLLSASAGQA
ncbi:YqgE/AlgH family protein [Sphingomonas sp.]|uniref:YqgE/AlgH family protein n=1 Tax=Sphingomonas sp. TaxID=28214 RepID=UPI002DBB98B7|nr:YqgE/AlgH family protein [Sphingomonas sp.]HEU4969720.1 YqgE/AlgH family protein [Sphingomonas sp.]